MTKILMNTSGNSELLLAVYATAKPGDLITYEKLSAAIGGDVRSTARNKSANYAALNKARHIHGLEFEARNNEGYVCLDGLGRVGKQERYLRATHSAARRGLRTVENINLRELDSAAKTRLLTQSSLLGAVELSTSRKAILTESKKSEMRLSLPDFTKG